MAVVVSDRVRGQWMKLVSRRLLAPLARWKFIHRIRVFIPCVNRKRDDIGQRDNYEGMSGPGKSVKPIRQLSLQPPVPRRQQIRRQRSAEDDKSLQICASSFARGKRGNAKSGSERPKVRVAWKENHQKNEKELQQVEVVARQIPGRSRPNTGRSRGFISIEKPSILYSRQELAERLRLAWKHREENKANINIFLARRTFEERCDSEMSSHTNISAPSSPVPKIDESKIEISLANNYKVVQDEEKKKENGGGITKRSIGNLSQNKNESTIKKSCDELAFNFKHSFVDMEESIALEETKLSTTLGEVSGVTKRKEEEKADTEKEQNEQLCRNSNTEEYLYNSKKKSSGSIDCSNSRVLSTTLASIKIENSALGVTKVSKEDFSSAKQKRASFHSGTNRAFLDPIKPPSENRSTIAEKNSPNRINSESKENITIEKSACVKNTSEFKYSSINEKNVIQKSTVDGKSTSTIDKGVRTMIEDKDVSVDDKTMTHKVAEANQFNFSIKRTASSSNIAEDKDSMMDKTASLRNLSEMRCSSVNEKSPPLKKAIENPKNDKKSRRTSSAPPQRHLESSSANRVQVNIVINSPNAPTSGKNKDQEKLEAECKDNAIEKVDMTVTKVSSSRSVRSAPLKRRSKSSKRRFWNSCRNDEDGKPRNRSAGRTRNSIDSKAIDIVTMVSLVSSADSDSDSENSPREDKLIDELRNKLPTTSIIKTSINSALSSARKPIKSVSFQKDSFDEDSPKEQQSLQKEEKKTTQSRLAIVNHRGNGTTLLSEETVSWRTDVAGLALPVLTLIHDIEEQLDVPLTDREKRCLAVPIGDLHDKKRKILKTRSTPSRSGMEKQMMSSKIRIQESPRIISHKMEVPAQQTKTSTSDSLANIKSTFASSKETVEHIQSLSTEPPFQTNKEKECWHLYRKMCDKGVCVSFDTVLRGMLTPTEYRLRQRELSQNL